MTENKKMAEPFEYDEEVVVEDPSSLPPVPTGPDGQDVIRRLTQSLTAKLADAESRAALAESYSDTLQEYIRNNM